MCKKIAVFLVVCKICLTFAEFLTIILSNFNCFYLMNKTELVDAIAKQAEITKVDAKKALTAFTETVAGALKKGDKIALVGFGTFSVSERKARTGRNPRTGAEIKIKAKKVAKFKPSNELSV
jgi:DNA-binding protein HU-beta